MAVVVCFLLIAWNAFPPDVPQSPMKMVRGEDGKFISDVDSRRGGRSFQAQAGKIESTNTMASAGGESTGDRARLACRRILVQNKSDHLLAKRVAGDFLDELKKLSYVDRIDYLPAGEKLQPGELSPDVFITLSLASLNESGLIDHVVDANVIVTMGNVPETDNHSVIDPLTPPLVEFRWKCGLEHHSTTCEVASSAAKYKLVAAEIAKQIGGAVVKQLGDWRDEYGLLPELPGEFYPEYHAPPELPLEGVESQIVFTGRGLLKHNETLWKCRTDKPLSEALVLVRGRLEVTGWKSSNDSDETYLRMIGPHGRLTAFGENADGLGIWLEKSAAGSSGQASGDKAAAKTMTTFFVRYEERATAAERDLAVDTLFDADARLETVLLFENQWTITQRERVLDRFAKHPPTTAATWLALANIHHRGKRDNEARDALRRAVALLRVEHDASSLKSKLNQLAKELGDEKLAEKLDAEPPDFELLNELGFLEISADSNLAPIEFDLDGAANYLVRNPGGEWRLLSFSAKPTAQGPNELYQLALAQAMPHSRSVSSGQTLNERHPVQQEVFIEGLGRLHFDVIKQPGQPRFTITAAVQHVRADGSPLPAAHADGVNPGQ